MIVPVNSQDNAPFVEWVNNSLKIAPHPALKQESLELAFSYDIAINASDLLDIELQEKLTANGIQTYWFPLGELFELPLENIYSAMAVMWHTERQNKKVFLHCMAGRNRSVTIANCYYFLRTGKHRPDSDKQVAHAKYKNNRLPWIFRMELFLEKCKELFNNQSIANNAYVYWIKKETLHL